MNFLITANPIARPVVTRTFAGLNDGITQVTLECGHTRSGLTANPQFQAATVECWQCVLELEDKAFVYVADAEATDGYVFIEQMPLFEGVSV